MKKFFLIFFILVPLFAIPLSYLQFPFFSSKTERSKELFIQGVKSFHEMSFEASKDFFLKSLNITPDFYFARRFLADSYLLSGEIENALDEYEILRNQFPNNEYINYKIQRIENLLIERKIMDSSKKEIHYTLWKEITIKDIQEKNLIPIDIQKDQKYIYVLNYDPIMIFVFDYEGNLVKKIKSNLFNRIKKPDRFIVYQNKLYISDFDLEEIFVYNIAKNRFEDSILNVPYPDDLFILNEILYIWSKKENKFYKFFLKDKRIENLEIKLDLKNFSDYDFATDGKDIYLAVENKIYKLDISGSILKEIETNIKKIQKIEFVNEILTILDQKNNLWILNQNQPEDNYHTIDLKEKENFYKIISFYQDQENLIIGDIGGKIYFYFIPDFQNQNLDFLITHIDSSQYPLITLFLKISHSFEGKSFENLDKEHFEIFENEQKIYKINARSRDQFLDRLNFLFLYEKDFLTEEFQFEKLFKENFFKFFEEMTINDKFLLGISTDNLKIIYDKPYPLDVYDLIKFPPPVEKGDLLKNIIQGIDKLIPLNGRKCLVVFTNEDSEFSNSFEFKKVLFLSKIYTIPIYVISLKFQNPDLIKLAQETKGKYYYFFNNYYYKEIYKKAKQIPYYDYIITYEAPTKYTSTLKNHYINVKVKLNYFQMGGYAESGYIIP